MRLNLSSNHALPSEIRSINATRASLYSSLQYLFHPGTGVNFVSLSYKIEEYVDQEKNRYT